MAGKPATAVASEFDSTWRRLNRAREAQIDVLARGYLGKRARDTAYWGLYMRLITSFERCIEELFLGMLSRRYEPPTGVNCRVTFASPKVAREVVYSGQSYIDWLPYDRTKRRAKAFFTGGRPFDDLPPTHERIMDRALAIRNVLAHRSPHAYRIYQATVLGGISLPPSQREPVRFLQSVSTRGTSPITRWEEYAGDLSAILHLLTA